MNTYIILTTVIIGLLGIIWTKNNILNTLIKFFLIGVSFWGGYLIYNLKLLG